MLFFPHPSNNLYLHCFFPLQSHHDVFRQMVELIGITSIMEVCSLVFHFTVDHYLFYLCFHYLNVYFYINRLRIT